MYVQGCSIQQFIKVKQLATNQPSFTQGLIQPHGGIIFSHHNAGYRSIYVNPGRGPQSKRQIRYTQADGYRQAELVVVVFYLCFQEKKIIYHFCKWVEAGRPFPFGKQEDTCLATQSKSGGPGLCPTAGLSPGRGRTICDRVAGTITGGVCPPGPLPGTKELMECAQLSGFSARRAHSAIISLFLSRLARLHFIV